MVVSSIDIHVDNNDPTLYPLSSAHDMRSLNHHMPPRAHPATGFFYLLLQIECMIYFNVYFIQY